MPLRLHGMEKLLNQSIRRAVKIGKEEKLNIVLWNSLVLGLIIICGIVATIFTRKLRKYKGAETFNTNEKERLLNRNETTWNDMIKFNEGYFDEDIEHPEDGYEYYIVPSRLQKKNIVANMTQLVNGRYKFYTDDEGYYKEEDVDKQIGIDINEQPYIMPETVYAYNKSTRDMKKYERKTAYINIDRVEEIIESSFENPVPAPGKKDYMLICVKNGDIKTERYNTEYGAKRNMNLMLQKAIEKCKSDKSNCGAQIKVEKSDDNACIHCGKNHYGWKIINCA